MIEAAANGRARPWEDEPITRGEYARDLSDMRDQIARLQAWIVGTGLSVATIVTSVVLLHGGR